MSLAIALHLIAAVIWIGGMFFSLLCLRPAAAAIDLPVRMQLWERVLRRFFPWVWGSAGILLVTGFWMFFAGSRGVHVHLMLVLGILMMLLAAHVYFAPFKRFRRLVGVHNWQESAKQLAQIRVFIAINLGLGLIVIVVASSAR